MAPLTFILLVILGFLIGIPSGMFGFGGSSISTPLLRILFYYPPYIALASPLPMSLVSSTIATEVYHRKNLINWKYALRISIGLIPGSILGAYFTKFTGGKILMYLTAGLIMYLAVHFLIENKNKFISREDKGVIFIISIGFLIGFLSGMLANGGGIFLVPTLIYAGLKLKNSIGTSMAVVLIGIVPSIAVHSLLGHIDWLLTLALSIGVFPGTFLGSHITIKIHSDLLRKIYGMFLFAFALYFLFFEIYY